MTCQDVVHSLFGFTGSADDETLVILQHLKPVLDIGCIVAEAFLRFSVQSAILFAATILRCNVYISRRGNQVPSSKQNYEHSARRIISMTTSIKELNLDELEKVNGGVLNPPAPTEKEAELLNIFVDWIDSWFD